MWLRGAKDGGTAAAPRLGRSGLDYRSAAFIVIVLGGGLAASHRQRLEYRWFPVQERLITFCCLITALGGGDLRSGATQHPGMLRHDQVLMLPERLVLSPSPATCTIATCRLILACRFGSRSSLTLLV